MYFVFHYYFLSQPAAGRQNGGRQAIALSVRCSFGAVLQLYGYGSRIDLDAEKSYKLTPSIPDAGSTARGPTNEKPEMRVSLTFLYTVVAYVRQGLGHYNILSVASYGTYSK